MQARMTIGSLVILAVVVPVLAAAGPIIQFDKKEHDFGKVFSGEEAKATFEFTNTGDGTLVIEKLRSSCGCTKAIEGSRELPPKGKSKIVATLDASGMKSGPITKTVTVHSNDPLHRVVHLKLLAEIVQELEVEPSSLAVKLGKFVENISFPVKVFNRSEKPVKMVGVKVLSNPGIEGKLDQQNVVIEPGGARHLAIDLHITKQKEKNFYLGRMRLLTDHPREKEIGMKFLIHFLSSD